MPVSPMGGGDTGNFDKAILANDDDDTGKLAAILAIADDDTGKLADHLTEILANGETINESGWRTEITTNRNGRRYWQWRKRGPDRQARYGGTFDTVPGGKDRQEKYWQRAKDKARDGRRPAGTA